jgi:hypothetical protein
MRSNKNGGSFGNYRSAKTPAIRVLAPPGIREDVLARIRSNRTDRLAELLPFNWKPAV